MKITILNNCSFTEYQLESIRLLGQITHFDGTFTETDAIERLKESEVAVVDAFKCPITPKVMLESKKLKLIVLNSIGYDALDVVYARQLGITVCNCPGYSTDAVAELVIALTLSLYRKINIVSSEPNNGNFHTKTSGQTNLQGLNIKGKTIGIIGFGSIGRRVAELAYGLGMKPIAYNRSSFKHNYVVQVDKSLLLQQSDIISINLALNEETEGFISSKELELVKPTAILINTSRGKHVVSSDLAKALDEGRIAGAGLDVIFPEENENPLLNRHNVIITPHIGWYTQDSIINSTNIIIENISSFLKCQPQNTVN